MQTAIIGFLSGKLTPNIAGSVIPNNADKVADKQVERKDISFVLKKTAKAAPACAKTAGPINAKIVSEPFNAMFVIAIGIRLQ